jgi:hypothetical protein
LIYQDKIVKKKAFSSHFRYQFDNLMSKGTPAMIGLLFAFTAVVLFVIATVLINSPARSDRKQQTHGTGQSAVYYFIAHP